MPITDRLTSVVESIRAAATAAGAPVAPVPPRPIAVAVPAPVVADRARCQALINMTAKGSADAEAERREAIRTGATPEEYQATVAARSILDAIRASKGDLSDS